MLSLRGLGGSVLAGVAGSVAASFASRYNAQYGPGAALAGVGWMTNNETLETLGGMSLGQSLAGQILGSGSANAEGGWY